jgi:hypothetical protein
MVHYLASLAAAGGRHVGLLQWDTCRPVFQSTPTGSRYPDIDGITPSVIIRAAGMWSRSAVAAWNVRAKPDAMLIGEVPLIGGRLRELADVVDDGAESLLASPDCRFVVVVPKDAMRAEMTNLRVTEHRSAGQSTERQDASPEVVSQMDRTLVEMARSLGFAVAGAYDPALYLAVYKHLLKERHVSVLVNDTLLSDANPVHRTTDHTTALLPGPDEAEDFVRRAEAKLRKA